MASLLSIETEGESLLGPAICYPTILSVSGLSGAVQSGPDWVAILPVTYHCSGRIPGKVHCHEKTAALRRAGQEDPARDFDADYTGGIKSKKQAQAELDENIAVLADLGYRLYAEGRRSLLLVLQGMDTAGKDGTIRHVMRGFNPQSCQVTSFKQPGVTTWPTISLADRRAAPRKGSSASSTARTTKTCWWSAFIISCPRRNGRAATGGSTSSRRC